MSIFNYFRKNGRLNRERDEIYSQLTKIGAYKREVSNELKRLEETEKRLRLRLNEVNIELKKAHK